MPRPTNLLLVAHRLEHAPSPIHLRDASTRTGQAPKTVSQILPRVGWTHKGRGIWERNGHAITHALLYTAACLLTARTILSLPT